MAREMKMALLVFLFFLFQVCSQLAFAHSAVKFLPGFEGPLPFELETGYVGVGDSEDVQLFYYFVKSERNPEEDPLLLWLTGGPGCSAFSGLVFEIGDIGGVVRGRNCVDLVLNPCRSCYEVKGRSSNHEIIKPFRYGAITKSLHRSCLMRFSKPILDLLCHSKSSASHVGVLRMAKWSIEFQGRRGVQRKLTDFGIESVLMDKVGVNGEFVICFQVSNIIFVDSPVGTGFSYARNNLAALTGDFKQANQLHQFLRKWLKDHPDFISSPVYVSGDSYSGIPIPVLAQEILNGNEEGIRPIISLQGYVLGNPATVPSLEANLKIPYAHGMGLISDELYESLKRSCDGEYQTVDPSNVECEKDIQYFSKCISGIQPAQILEPICPFASPRPQEIGGKRDLEEQHGEVLLEDEPPPPPPLPTLGCRTYAYLLCYYWANDDNVQKALHIRKGSIGQWQRCTLGLPYTADVPSSFPYHANLSARGIRALIYSGDHDLTVPFLATQAWIRSLNYTIVDDWRPWVLRGQVAGYTRTYSNRMTFATVKARKLFYASGGGHTAPEYRPAECLAMFKRWISEEPL
ncbi:hypothetical protein SCA6_008984 [Theobroma cacao]